MPMDAEERGRLERKVRRAQEGDPLAFEELVRRFREPLTSFAFALVRDPGLAEDVAQETFILAYRGLGTLRDPSAFRPWIYRIAEHAALTGRRRRGNRRLPGLRDPDAVAEPPSGFRDPAEEAAAREERPELVAVRDSMTRIPEHYAAVLALHYVEGFTCREIGETLGITLNNAKVRLYRARNALRRDLEAKGIRPPVPLESRGREAS